MAQPRSPGAARAKPEIQVFLAEIKSHPDEDTPRLVLADWLQEYGTSEEADRGELLRIEVLLSQMPGTDPRKEPLRRRRGELRRRHLDLWLGPLIHYFTWSFERGFLHLETRGEILVQGKVADLAVPELCQWLESLTVREVQGQHIPPIACSPFLPYVHTLDLSAGQLRSGGLSDLVRFPQVAHLKTLVLTSNHLGPGGADVLATSRHLAGLTTLDLRGCSIGDEGAGYLARSPFLGNLIRLRLGGNRISEEGQAIVRARFADRVTFS